MANTRAANVWIVDTTGAITSEVKICSIKFIAGSDASTMTIKNNASSTGTVVYEVALASGQIVDWVEVVDRSGIYVTFTGTSPKAYLYME